jgi:hypothetical protein
MSTDIAIAKAKELSEEEREIARLMVFGLPHEEIVLGKLIKPNWPLTLEQAAKFVGYRLKRARAHLDPNPIFRGHRGELLEQRRKGEQARNLETAIAIRDYEGENLAADRTVRLKAIATIEGRGDGPNVTVNVNQQNNTATIQPGYVIRLPAGTPMPASIEPEREPLTIEASRAD